MKWRLNLAERIDGVHPLIYRFISRSDDTDNPVVHDFQVKGWCGFCDRNPSAKRVGDGLAKITSVLMPLYVGLRMNSFILTLTS